MTDLLAAVANDNLPRRGWFPARHGRAEYRQCRNSMARSPDDDGIACRLVENAARIQHLNGDAKQLLCRPVRS
jgi:hypothetical protein